MQGLPNAPIYDVSLTNCDFGAVKNPSVVANVIGLKLKNVKIDGKVVQSLEGSTISKPA
jgi:hypothetical protein